MTLFFTSKVKKEGWILIKQTLHIQPIYISIKLQQQIDYPYILFTIPLVSQSISQLFTLSPVKMAFLY